MKTVDEWANRALEIPIESLIREIQSDAFHAGQLKGLQEAKDLISNRFQEEVHGVSLEK